MGVIRGGLTKSLVLFILFISAAQSSHLDLDEKRGSLEEFEEGLAVLKRTLAEKGVRFGTNDWVSNEKPGNQQQQQQEEKRDRRAFVNNYYVDLNKRLWGKHTKINPGIINIGLGKRNFNNDAALKYIGLGKRNMNDAGLKYIGLGKRSISGSGLKYVGLGKRNFNQVGLKYIGLGKRFGNDPDKESEGEMFNTPDESQVSTAPKTGPQKQVSKRCWNRFGSRVCGWRRLRTRGGANSWRYYQKFRRMLIDPKYVMMGIGK